MVADVFEVVEMVSTDGIGGALMIVYLDGDETKVYDIVEYTDLKETREKVYNGRMFKELFNKKGIKSKDRSVMVSVVDGEIIALKRYFNKIAM